MTAKYDRDAIRFQYPDSWTLEEDPPQGIPRSISVTSETGAFWSLTLERRDAPLELLRSHALDTFRQEYKDVEVHDVVVDLGHAEVKCIDLHFYCLDFLVHSRLISLAVGSFHCLLTWQAEDRDFDSLEAVFRAVTMSLLSESSMQ